MKISVITLLVLLIMCKVQAQLNSQDLQRTGSERNSSKGINNQSNSIPILNTKILNSFSENMVEVEGGTFIMGCKDDQGKECNENERPAHKVSVNSFKISKYEVTRAQWRAVMGISPYIFKGCDQCAVENVSWNDLQKFLANLNNQTGRRFRLPTEAEWEYAARGGNKSQGYKYSGSNYLRIIAWYRENSKKTKPVGQKKSNELGLYDMTGNVSEWCSDWYGEKYYEKGLEKNPQGPEIGKFRVIRGGSWLFDMNDLFVSNRDKSELGLRRYDGGFRLVEY
jgi:formylglycine-generating enzyme required for sulfatase activity